MLCRTEADLLPSPVLHRYGTSWAVDLCDFFRILFQYLGARYCTDADSAISVTLCVVWNVVCRHGKSFRMNCCNGNPDVRGPMKVRAILWTVAMAYTGFLLTGQGLRTFNSLSITEVLLGALAGFLLAIMFTHREERRRRPALIAHSIAQIMPDWEHSSEHRGSGPKLKH